MAFTDVVTASVVQPNPNSLPAPLVAENANYVQDFDEDFSSFSLGTIGVASSPGQRWFNGVPGGYGPTLASNIFVQNGVLNLRIDANNGGANVSTSNGIPGDPANYYVAGDCYVEARIKCRNWTAFWTFPKHWVESGYPVGAVSGGDPNSVDAGNPSTWVNEIDGLESSEPDFPQAVFCNDHSNTGSYGGVGDQSIWDMIGQGAFEAGVDITQDFHVFAWWRTGKRIRYYFDGNLLHDNGGTPADVPGWDSGFQPQMLICGIGNGGANVGNNGIFNPDPDGSVTALVDWVRTWIPAQPGGGGGGTNFPSVGSAFTTPNGTSMTLKKADEFVGTFRADINKNYIDRTLWQPNFWQGTSERTLSGNGEAQYYMDPDYAGASGTYQTVDQRPNPFEFTGDASGILKIKSFPVPQADWANYWMGVQRRFASGLLCSAPDIHTGQPYSPTNRTSAAAHPGWLFQYGYCEVRAKLCNNYGAWPAWWWLHDDTPDGFSFVSAESDYYGRINEVTQYHAWPPELDGFEFFGHRPTKHSFGYAAISGEAGFFQLVDKGVDLSQDFHIWGMEVNATNILLSFDGNIVFTTPTPGSWKTPGRRWYTLFDAAVGGNWYAQEINSGSYGLDSIVDEGGNPITAGNCKAWTVAEGSMPWTQAEIDYIRWYE